MSVGPPWSKTEDELLLTLWLECHSFREMSWEFPGRTRNSCIGRLARLRKILGTEMVPQGRSVKPVRKKRVRRKVSFVVKRPAFVVAAPKPVKVAALPPAARLRSLLQLGPADCRYIVTDSDTRPHLYCAADATANVDPYGGNCYCDYHRRIMRVAR
jgi:hypothetical protein